MTQSCCPARAPKSDPQACGAPGAPPPQPSGPATSWETSRISREPTTCWQAKSSLLCSPSQRISL